MKPAAIYDYTDEKGQLLFQKLRFEPKSFFQRRPNGKGGWIAGLNGTPRVPYKLPEIVRAENKAATIFIAEGEKAVECLRKHGLIATCGPDGSSVWRPALTPYFKNRAVVVLPDNDDVGRRHAERVAQALNGVAASVKVLALPELPPGGDVFDWFQNGGSRDRLITLGEKAEPFKATAKEVPESMTHPEADSGTSEIVALLAPFWTEGQRHKLALGVAAHVAKNGWPWAKAEALFKRLSKVDTELRWTELRDSYKRVRDGKDARGYASLREILPAAVLERIEELVRNESIPVEMRLIDDLRRKKTVSAHEKKRAIAYAIRDTLAQEGEFLRTPGPRYWYFSTRERRLNQLEDRDFRAMLDLRFGLNPSEEATRYVLEELASHVHASGKVSEVFQVAHWNKKTKTLYVDLGAGQIARLNGEKIELLDNGTDGILFQDEIEPVTPDFSRPVDLRKIMTDGNFGGSLSHDAQSILEWSYIRSLFFYEQLSGGRPILVYVGPKGSGKTSKQKRILRLLFGSRRPDPDSVNELDAFETSISRNFFLAFDNVDERLPWLNDALAKVATGQTIRRRKLYSTLDEFEIRPRCFVALNSRTPFFKREDVADRLLILRLERLAERKFTRVEKLLDEVSGTKRNRAWGALLRELNSCVKWLRTHELRDQSTHRLADWATLAEEFSAKDGELEDLKAALDAMDKERVRFTLEDDQFVPYIDRFCDGKKRSAKQIWDLMGGSVSPFKSALSLSRHLSQSEESLKACYGLQVERDRHTEAKIYLFPVAGVAGVKGGFFLKLNPKHTPIVPNSFGKQGSSTPAMPAKEGRS